MQIETRLPDHGSWQEIAAAACFAEEAGMDTAVAVELSHDPFQPLAVAAHATSRIRVATGVALAFPRSPTTVAASAHDLHARSGGRFSLGLGSQIKPHIERRFGATWSAPVPRMREYVEAVRAVWNAWEHGEPLRVDGEHYRLSLMTPEFSQAPTGLPPIPISVAAVGPGMLRLAATCCDGVRLHGFATRRYLEQVAIPALTEGLASAGRGREHFEIAGGGFVCTAATADELAKGAEEIRYRVGFYGSTPAYRGVLSAHGWDDLGDRLHALTKAGQWDRLAAEVPDEVLHTVAAVATHAELAAAIEARFGGVADTVAVDFAPGTDPGLAREIVSDIRRIPAAFEGPASG